MLEAHEDRKKLFVLGNFLWCGSLRDNYFCADAKLTSPHPKKIKFKFKKFIATGYSLKTPKMGFSGVYKERSHAFLPFTAVYSAN